ncbi:unnamed protein product, partial [Brachionus calyciflorus]
MKFSQINFFERLLTNEYTLNLIKELLNLDHEMSFINSIVKNLRLQFCNQSEHFTVFRNLQKIQFGITVKYFPNICPLIFDGLNLFSLKFLGISQSLVKQNILTFIELFRKTNSLTLIGSLEEVDADSLTIFKNLEELNLQLTNFDVLMSKNSSWIFTFLQSIQTNFNLDLMFSDFYDFPNEDFCLFLPFPKNGSINPIFYLRNITCSCTIIWLLQNEDSKKTEDIIQMNKNLCNNLANINCNFSQMK